MQGTRRQSISLLAACFLPFKQSSESGDSEQSGYWSYTRPFFPTQNTGKSGLGTRLSRIYSFRVPISPLATPIFPTKVATVKALQSSANAAATVDTPNRYKTF